MSANPLWGALPPPRSDKPFYPIISPKGPEVIHATLLSPGFGGFWTHWDGRPIPCTQKPDCPRCLAGLGWRWTGYIAAYSHEKKMPVVLMLSEAAANQLLPVIAKHGTLRGLKVSLQRASKTKVNSKVIVTEHGWMDPERMERDFDIMPSLQELWCINERWLAGGKRPDAAKRPAALEEATRFRADRLSPGRGHVPAVEPDENGEVPLC